ncbi:MAG: acyl carrier protein [Planctomycetota bacterium]
MTPEQLDQELERVFTSVFGLPPGGFNRELSMETLAEWDSIAHVMLVLGLESALGVHFGPDEAATLTTVVSIREKLLARGVGDG